MFVGDCKLTKNNFKNLVSNWFSSKHIHKEW